MQKRAETPLQAKKVRETSKDTDKKPKGPKKPRSPAQMEATRKMIEAGKAKRFKSGDEAAKNGRKGGKKSGESKRTRKNMQELAKYMLDLPLHEGEVDEDGSSFDSLGGKNTTVRGRIIKNLVTKASNGDLHAIGMLADLAGEAPVPQLHVEVKDTSKMTVSELIEYRRQLRDGE